MTAANTLAALGNGPTFAYGPGASGQSLSQNVWTKITMFTGLNWDTTNGMYANSRFTPTVAGYYFVTAAAVGTDTAFQLSIYKNGAGTFTYVNSIPGGWMRTSAIIYMNGTSDYLEVYAVAANAGQSIISNGGLDLFSAALIRGA